MLQNWPTPKSNRSTDMSGQSESSICADISSASSDATTTSVNPYAIPNCKNSAANKSNSIAGDSQDEVFYFRSVSEPGTAFEYCACGQPVCGDQPTAGFLIVFESQFLVVER